MADTAYHKRDLHKETSMGDVIQFPPRSQPPSEEVPQVTCRGWLPEGWPSQVRGSVLVLSRRRARRAIEDQIRAAGQKRGDFTLGEIMERAKAYLEEHPEIRQEVIEMIASDPHLRRLCKIDK